MLTQCWTIARKEVLDGLRDTRSLISAAMYALMGPAVVCMVSIAIRGKDAQSSTGVLIGMMSVFTLVAAFVGGISVAMDTLAGERERRSLVPLLMNPVSRADVILGKWMAVSFFTTAGLALNLAGFAVVFRVAGMRLAADLQTTLWMLVCGLLPLALMASALELTISTACRAVKEAHTYLSSLVFLPMGAGMFLVFFPTSGAWRHVLPVVGQQWQLEQWMQGGAIGAGPSLMLGWVTAAFTACVLWIAANRLERDDVVYGS